MVTTTRSRARPAIVAARGIVNRFGAQRVHDKLDLEVRPGEVLGIAGGSGSGKSVLLRTLIGLHRPTAGHVELDGQPVDRLAPADRAALLGVLFQQGALFSSLSVAQNIMLPLREHGRATAEQQARIAALKLALVGLPPESGLKMPAQLSGGMVKRAALARALALDPRLLFLDEPTAGLDAASAAGIDELIERLNGSLGVTIVLISHDLATLFSVCHRIAVLAEGRLVIDKPAALLRAKAAAVRELFQGPRARAAWTAVAKENADGNR